MVMMFSSYLMFSPTRASSMETRRTRSR